MAPAMNQSKTVRIHGVYDVNRDRSSALAKQYGAHVFTELEDVLADSAVDAVYIATPTAYHKELCISAAKAGKHILCEKSLAMNSGEALEIVAACKKGAVLLREGFMYRHHSQHQFAYDMVQKGEIGDPVLFSAWFGFPSFPESDFRMQKDLGGGAVLDAGAYVVNAARFFFKREPVSCHSYTHLNADGLDVRGSAIMDFGGGQTANLAYGMNKSYKNSYSIWGTKGELTLLRAFSIPAWEIPVCQIINQGLKREYSLAACNHFSGELEDFANAAQKNEFDFDEAVHQAKSLDMLRTANQSENKAD